MTVLLCPSIHNYLVSKICTFVCVCFCGVTHWGGLVAFVQIKC